jgi:CofD-related protein of GAK system
MQRIKITRSVTVPDPVRLARCLKAPELGPRVLFFTGGTALRDISRELVRYTHHSIHLITPFDSGGSSAELRRHFGMLAVGDLRNRLMALADRSVQGNPEIYNLFAHRLPKDQPQEALARTMWDMIQGKNPLVAAVPDPMRKIIRQHLKFFALAMPEGFRLAGASIGNLILAGGYFNNNRQIDPVIYMFTKLVEARGVVRPIVTANLTLAAELEDGVVLAGQHLLTGKETREISSPVKRVFLCKDQTDLTPVSVGLRQKMKNLIATAELICYPLGSFYSSLVANLLPQGVGHAVGKAACPKVFVPNPAGDPEQLGLSVGDSVLRLLDYLRADSLKPVPAHTLLNFVLLDEDPTTYAHPMKLKAVEALGVKIIRGKLKTKASAPYFDERAVVEHLLSLT